jgi:transposase
MIKVEEWMEIKDLYNQGYSQRAIARMMGLSRNTVKRALEQVAPQPYTREERDSKLDDYKSYIEQRYEECALSAVRLMEEIVPMGYTGGIDTVRRHLRTLRPAKGKMSVRFETPAGQQAQVDWASCGQFIDENGHRTSTYAFVMVLSFSRMLFVEFTRSMSLPTLIGCHQNAFEFFGGWTHSILYDNMKQVRLTPQQWNPLFLDFANHYGFTPKTHRVRRPRTKGKVERMVHYLKDNFLNGRTFSGIEDLNSQVKHWLSSTANVRVHATTGERPVDLLKKEAVIRLESIAPYQVSTKFERRVDSEGFVRLGRSRYSVPPEHAGHVVIVEQQEQRVLIRSGDLIIAEHPQAPTPGACMVQREHVDELWKLSLKRTTPPPSPTWTIALREAVESTPLSYYEEVVG